MSADHTNASRPRQSTSARSAVNDCVRAPRPAALSQPSRLNRSLLDSSANSERKAPRALKAPADNGSSIPDTSGTQPRSGSFSIR